MQIIDDVGDGTRYTNIRTDLQFNNDITPTFTIPSRQEILTTPYSRVYNTRYIHYKEPRYQNYSWNILGFGVPCQRRYK